MKLIIDIDEKEYIEICEEPCTKLGLAIANGTPLEAQSTDEIKEAYLKGYDYGVKDWFKSKAQPCEDAISREAVLEGLASIAKAKAKSDAQKSMMGRCMFFVEQLPSVTPKRPKGKWIGKYISGATDYEVLIKQWQIAKCNKCGKEYKTPYTDCKFVDYAYCPNCGAEMEGGKDENNSGC